MKRSESGPPPRRRATSRWTRCSTPRAFTGAEAIHPGYGFLSESAGFADACAARGIVFIGPTPAHLRDFGLKHTARAIAAQGGVPLLPGTELLAGVDEAAEKARAIGYPVMLKSTAGGGGIGMRLCRDEAELRPAFEAVERVSQASFGQQRPLSGKVRGERAPHRSADLRRWRRGSSGSGRARLFGAAPQSEGDRGDAGAQDCRTRRAAH